MERSSLLTPENINIFNILVTFDTSHFDMSKFEKLLLEVLLNMLSMFVTLLVFHLDISGNSAPKELVEQLSNI